MAPNRRGNPVFDFEMQNVDLETRNEVAKTLKPLIIRQAEAAVETNVQKLYTENLERRLSALEVVFDQGAGKNFIMDTLLNKIEEEKTERVLSITMMRDFFELTRQKVDDCIEDIAIADEKFK